MRIVLCVESTAIPNAIPARMMCRELRKASERTLHEEGHWQHCMGRAMNLAPLLPAWQALALLAALAAPAAARLEARSTASEYISTVCGDYSTAYGPLVESYLSQFQGGFSTADILQLPAMYNGSRSGNLICLIMPTMPHCSRSTQTAAATCHTSRHRACTRLPHMA